MAAGLKLYIMYVRVRMDVREKYSIVVSWKHQVMACSHTIVSAVASAWSMLEYEKPPTGTYRIRIARIAAT